MNRTDLVRRMGANKKERDQARVYLDRMIELVQKELLAGKPVNLRGLGMFEVVVRAPRTGRTLDASGKSVPIAIPARRTIHFRPAATIKERLA